MTYLYELTSNDLKNMGLEPTKAKKYAVEQSGWTCLFGNITEIIYSKYGEFKGAVIEKGSLLSEKQKNYIIKNTSCKEY